LPRFFSLPEGMQDPYDVLTELERIEPKTIAFWYPSNGCFGALRSIIKDPVSLESAFKGYATGTLLRLKRDFGDHPKGAEGRVCSYWMITDGEMRIVVRVQGSDYTLTRDRFLEAWELFPRPSLVNRLLDPIL
jgi:hypothetical protein